MFIYLASPYTHPEWTVRAQRLADVAAVTERYLRAGYPVFSPIVYGDPFEWVIGTEFEHWQKLNDTMVASCAEVWVLQLPGWEESKGIAHEVKLARSLRKPVKYLTADGEFIQCS